MDGANFLRDVVEFLNSRNENENDGKNVRQLIADYLNSEAEKKCGWLKNVTK